MTVEGGLVLATCADLPGLHHDEGTLLDALRERGVIPRILAWDDPSVDWSRPSLVVPRSTWDYVPRRAEFVAWATHVAEVSCLLPSAEVVGWNTDKRYLRRLTEAGVPVVPTRWAMRGEAVDLAALLAEEGWSEVVVKPVVSAGSFGTVRFPAVEAGRVQAHLDDLLAAGDVMIQPFLPSIPAEGELSVIWIAGALSHAVVKRPRPGDFRVQEEFGAVDERVDLDDDLVSVAEAVLHHIPDGCCYARIDLAAGLDGTLQLMELELVEPQLFLRHHPPAAQRLADGLVAALADRRAA